MPADLPVLESSRLTMGGDKPHSLYNAQNTPSFHRSFSALRGNERPVVTLVQHLE